MPEADDIQKELGDVDPEDSPEIADAKKQAAAQKQEKSVEERVQELIASKEYYLPIKK